MSGAQIFTIVISSSQIESLIIMYCPSLSFAIFFILRSTLSDMTIAHLLLGFPGSSEVKASACNAGDLGSIPGLGRFPGEGNGNPLQYSCLENPMDGETQQDTVHGVTKSRIRLSDFTFTFTLTNIPIMIFKVLQDRLVLSSRHSSLYLFPCQQARVTQNLLYS